jgi:hypothetical protein
MRGGFSCVDGGSGRFRITTPHSITNNSLYDAYSNYLKIIFWLSIYRYTVMTVGAVIRNSE